MKGEMKGEINIYLKSKNKRWHKNLH